MIIFNPHFHFTVDLLLQPLMAGRMNYWWVKIIVGNWITNRKLKSTSCGASGRVEPLLFELIHASFVMSVSYSLWSTSRYSFFCSSVQKETFRLSRVTGRDFWKETLLSGRRPISPKLSNQHQNNLDVKTALEQYHKLTTKINSGAHVHNSQARSPVSKLL